MQTRSLGKPAEDRPLLLHYPLKGGYSSGLSLKQLIQEQADELSFLWMERAVTHAVIRDRAAAVSLRLGGD